MSAGRAERVQRISRKRPRVSLPVLRCPPVRAACARIGCRWWASSEVKPSGAIVIFVDGGRFTIPLRRTAHRAVNETDIEHAAELVARRVAAGPTCSLLMIRRAPDGMTLDAIGKAIGGLTREAARRVEEEALTKVGPQLAELGWGVAA